MPGTIHRNYKFDKFAAAEQLRNALHGKDTKEEDIIKVLISHSNAQRLHIGDAYKQKYKADLVDDLKSELSGDFEDTVVALITAPQIFDARELNRAISGAGTDETVLIEIMCTRNNEQIEEIKRIYKAEFKNELKEDLVNDTSGHFGRMLVLLCTAARKEDEWMVDDAEAKADAEKLHDIGGTDENEINAILCLRSRYQLRKTFDKFEELYGKTIEESLESECSSDLKNVILAIVKMMRSPPAFFAERLYDAMKGLGTNDKDLIRLVVSRSEIDLQDIKQEYEQRYGQSLAEAIDSECGGNYKKLLMMML